MPNGENRPLATIVIATHDRAHLLERLMASLESQTVPRRDFEVIVVDDGSTDSTASVLERLATTSAGRFRALAAPRSRGPAAARNIGWRAAEGALIAFTDDDCVPEPGWLAAGLRAVASGSGIVMGRTRALEEADGYGEPFSRTMEVDREDGRYPTCNVFYLREALTRAGGFDEAFSYACGEDTDLAWRVKQLGFASAFAADAIVIHDVRPPSFATFLKERRRFADQILLVKRHPHLRRLFYRRYFYQRSHVHAIAALALIAVAGSGLWPAATLLPIVWLDRFRHTRLRGAWGRRALVAGELLLGDLWELFVFCYASLRYKTLLI